jgi:hypothetical protein
VYRYSSGARRRRGRSLAAVSASYDVEVFFSPTEVDAAALSAAAGALTAAGVEGAAAEASVDPVAELRTIPGVDVGAVEAFETEAKAGLYKLNPVYPQRESA